MNSAQSLGPLNGRIVFRLELDEDCSNVGARNSIKSKSNKGNGWKVCGFVFIPHEHVPHSTEFLLSLPHNLRTLACEASILQQTVYLTSYTYIDSIEARQTDIAPLLEVHCKGMEIREASRRSVNQQFTRSPTASYVWSLRQFRRYEAVFGEEMKAKKQKGKRKEKEKEECDLYDIVATVDAISPIVSMDPTMPFAFVDLYDSQHPEETCILVLQNQRDLIYWYGIFPGDKITIHRVRRKAWLVPDTLQQDKKKRFEFLGDRIPSFVLTTVSTSTIDLPQRSFVPPIPATTVPLVSLEGQITHVEMTSNKEMHRLIHWIVLLGDNSEGSQGVKLFLTLFPMDTALQLSLQVGARIRAVNVHKLCDECPVSFGSAIFGACLRSTVSIITMASESRCYNDDRKGDRVPYLRSENPSPLRLHTQTQRNMPENRFGYYPIPFHLKRIETSYHDYIYQYHIEKWLNENFRNDEESKLPAIPSGIELHERLRKNGHILQGQAHRSTLRNPYAEFFDHGAEEIGPNELEETFSGCMLSRYDYTSNFQAVFLGLGKIKSSCVESLVRKFDASLRDGTIMKFPGVWSGSIHLQAHDILSASSPDHSSSAKSRLFTGGRVVETRSNGSTPASISDNCCQIPLHISKKFISTKGDFITLRIEKVVVSCLCLRAPKRTTESENEVMSKALSPVKTAFFNNEYINGACTLLRIHGCLLIVALHLVASKSLFPTQKENDQAPPENDSQIETIASLLSDPLLFTNCKTGDCTSGIVLRHRFAPKKINPMGHSQCCKLTICSTVEDPDTLKQEACNLLHLQTMDNVKLSVPCPENIRERFKEAFACVSEGVKLAEDEYALGACWWTLADSGRTCALTSGGWDELQPNSPQHLQNQLGIRLRFPMSTMQLGGRGYVRCSVHSTQLEADYVPTWGMEAKHSHTLLESNFASGNFSGFHFLGCERVYDGMLQRRPPRRLACGSISTRTIGPLLYPPKVPAVNLSTLFSQLCRSLRERETNHIPLAPSMVRHLSHAIFLGVSFCQAQCFCSKCFKPLISPRPENHKHKKRRHEEAMDEPSFWHLPHPNQCLDVLHRESKSARPPTTPQPKIPKHIRDSPLECPEGHSAEFFAVRWECSGILDDGTGQAKLYSDGEAALTLLGMDKFTIKSIEEGIWSVRNGTIQYKKSMPPPEFLRSKVMDAFIQSRRHKHKNPLFVLDPSFRAEYLVHHHCRSSKEPRRPLEYYVRCKPLSDQIPHLHHTMVESSVMTRSVNGSQEYALGTQDVATYSLPPLKLVLVDCAIPSEENVFVPRKL